MKKIPELKFGAYDSFYEPLERYLEEVAAAAPELVNKSQIGRSREGRSLSLLTITDYAAGAPEDKPAILIFANMHCHELSGPIASLRTVFGLLEDRPALLRDTTFYVIPRINPDGAEKVLKQSGFIRSRWDYSHRTNTIHHEDVDGNGIVSNIRKECPWGDKCLDPNDPTRLIDRTADSKGPFYLLFAEGSIEKWDGILLPPEEIEGDYRDWNRNWPVGWSPESPAHGDFPCSEPEMYALATFMATHKNIFGTIDFHNGWAGILTPKNIRNDDAKFLNKLSFRAGQLTGFPMMSGGEYPFKQDPKVDMQFLGQFIDHAYHNYGLAALTIELGTFENSAGIRTEQIIGHDYPEDYNPNPQVIAYQKSRPEQREAFHEWKTFEHPQLGKIEIGGFDCVGIASPAPEMLAKVCDATYRFICEFAAKKPQLKVMNEELTAVAPGLVRLRLILQNAGEFPTYVLSPGKKSAWRKQPYAELELPDGVECLSHQRGARMPHFAAWESRLLEYFLRYDPATPKGNVTLRIDGGAAGTVIHTITLA